MSTIDKSFPNGIKGGSIQVASEIFPKAVYTVYRQLYIYVFQSYNQKVYRHPSSYRKHINADHYERRHELTLDATSVFYADKKDTDPTKQYARIFGRDGFMEVENDGCRMIEDERTSPALESPGFYIPNFNNVDFKLGI